MNNGRNGSGRFHLVWRGMVAPLVLVLNLAWGWGAASPKSEPDELQVQVGKTIEITSSHRYCWIPNVHQMPTGEILVGIKMFPDENNTEGAFTAYCMSKDGGLTWSRRFTLGAEGYGGSYSASPRPDGSIWRLNDDVEPLTPGPAKQFKLTLAKFWRGGMECQEWRDVPLQMSERVHPAHTELFDRHVQDGHLAEQPISHRMTLPVWDDAFGVDLMYLRAHAEWYLLACIQNIEILQAMTAQLGVGGCRFWFRPAFSYY